MSSEPLRYPITKEWRERVREKLDTQGRGSHFRLCEEIGISKSVLSQMLNGELDTSPHVEAIHAYFGWSPPLPPTAALDSGETVNAYMRMTPEQRMLMDTASSVLRGVQGEQAKRALVELLRLCRSY